MCKSSKLSKVGIQMANYYMDKIGEIVGAQEILETCDQNGIRHQGYGAIYKRFKELLKVHEEVLESVICQIHTMCQL